MGKQKHDRGFQKRVKNYPTLLKAKRARAHAEALRRQSRRGWGGA